MELLFIREAVLGKVVYFISEAKKNTQCRFVVSLLNQLVNCKKKLNVVVLWSSASLSESVSVIQYQKSP